MPWSRVSAGGSATTWSSLSATGSSTTWNSSATGARAMWTPYAPVADLWQGVDFVPKASAMAAGRASIDRPLQIWSLSVITSSAFSAEGEP